MGQPFQIYDGAGVVTNVRYDFKGNLLESQRTLLQDYKTPVNWPALASPPQPLPHLLESERFVSRSRYDALNRPQQIIAPHSNSANPLRINVTQPGYNAAGLLERVDLWFNRTAAPDDLLATATADQPMVQNIEYNAKGQRVLIAYGNGATTTYDYDDETFRLTKLRTTRPNRPAGVLSALFEQATVVQDLSYTYDPVGNITRIADASHKSFLQGGQEVAAAGYYSYDALYRLTAASGREHSGQMGFDLTSPDGNYRDQPFVGHRSHANDLQGLASYVERYRYDAVGNILEMAHHDGSTIDQPGEVRWRRHYEYALDSNQLLATSAPGDPDDLPHYVAEPGYSQRYSYDFHGNMTQMPHLPLMTWDFKDQLHAASQQVRAAGGTPETTYYLYDAGGQRVRKVTERQAAPDQPPRRKSERIYLGGFEIYREYNGDGATVTLARETLHIMDDQQRIALVETQTAPTVGQPLIRYQFGNHLGSASVELDQNGGLISYEEYHPYGTTSFQAGRSAAEVSLKRYRYTGKERDEETGLSYHETRYYAPWLGRWTSADSAGLVDSANLYAYVRGRPLNLVDPGGTNGADPDGVIRVPGTSSASLYHSKDGNAKILADPETSLATDPAFKGIAEEVQAGMRSNSYESFRSTLNQKIKNILVSEAEHPLKKLLEVKNDKLYWKSGTAYAGQELNYAHTIAQESIKNLGAEEGAAVALENLSPVGKEFHLKTYGHPEEIATKYMKLASEEAKTATRAGAADAAIRRQQLRRATSANQRGFVSIGGLIFALVMVGTTVYAVGQAQDKSEAIKEIAADAALGWAVARIAGGAAAFAIGLRSDNPAVTRERERETAQMEVAKDFMRKYFPDKVKIRRYWFDDYDPKTLAEVKKFLFETSPTRID